MKIGLIDVDGHNFPNLPLMKISAWHKSKGDDVEMVVPIEFKHYDKVYMSKVFTFTDDYPYGVDSDEVIKAGTGYAIQKDNGLEVYHKELDRMLPEEIEHIYPDYSLYHELTKNRAFGFLTRGCPRGCNFCHVANKEGRCSVKVADLSEFWRGQEFITLCDPNFFSCKDWKELSFQIIDSKAKIDFNQGIDVRIMDEQRIDTLNQMRIDKSVHLAWDNPKQDLTKKFKFFSKHYKRKSCDSKVVYVLVNFDSTFDEDLYRIYTLRELKFDPYVMIYDKENCDDEYKRLQRWVNNRFIWRACRKFEDYK